MNLKAYLRRERISQSEFARRVGVTQGAVWQWLEGKQRISAEKALLIEDATAGVVSRHDLRSDLWPIRDRA